MAQHVSRAAGLVAYRDLTIQNLKYRPRQTVDRKLLPRGDVEDLSPSGRRFVDAHGGVGHLAHEDEIARLLSITIDGHRFPSQGATYHDGDHARISALVLPRAK